MKNRTRDLVMMAMYLALFFVLDYIANQLPLFKMPNGGTLGLGVLALILSSYDLGWKKGVVVSLMSVLLQFLTGQMYIVDFVQFVLEYVVAFGVYGLSGLFPNKSYIYTGVIVTNVIRLVLHTLAGVWYWGLTLIPSFSYNGWYMIPTMIVCMILVPLVDKSIKRNQVKV